MKRIRSHNALPKKSTGPSEARRTSQFRCVSGPSASSSIPNLAALPLHSDAGGSADLDPDQTRTGSIGASTFFDTMPSAPSRQACAKTIGPSSAMCSLSRMPASVLRNRCASAAFRSRNRGLRISSPSCSTRSKAVLLDKATMEPAPLGKKWLMGTSLPCTNLRLPTLAGARGLEAPLKPARRKSGCG
jgi:hypothetical protein